MFGSTVGWVLWISDETGVKARVFQRRGKTNGKKNSIDFVVPVPRTATEAIKCFKEEPVFLVLGISFRVPRRRTNDSSFLRRENPMTKGILTITLLKRTTFFHREADQETKRVTMLEPKITRTPKKTRTHLHRQKRQTTPNNLPKWPKHYRTAPPP